MADQTVFNAAAGNGAAFLKTEYGMEFPEPLTDFQHSVEQATYLEWQNSAFSEAETLRSCQSCHMYTGFETPDRSVRIDQITTQIASIQDSTYPDVANRLPISMCRSARDTSGTISLA